MAIGDIFVAPGCQGGRGGYIENCTAKSEPNGWFKMSTDIPGPFRQFIVPSIVYFLVVGCTTQNMQTSTETHESSSQTAAKEVPDQPKEVPGANTTAPENQTTTQTADSPTGNQLNQGGGTETSTATVDNSPAPDGNSLLGSRSNENAASTAPSESSHAIAKDASSLNSRLPSQVPSAVADPVDANSAIDLIINAQAIHDQSSIDRAQSFLDTLPKPSPGDVDDAKRLNKLGLKDLRAKSFLTSIGFFANASKDDPSNALYLSNLGYAEMNAGDLTSAENHLRASIALDRSRAVAWGDLALTFAKQGDQNRAVSCLLIGYSASNGKSRPFIESLQQDEDTSVREIGTTALAKLQPEQPQ
jgi:Flp pilus assembly protein TadD